MTATSERQEQPPPYAIPPIRATRCPGAGERPGGDRRGSRPPAKVTLERIRQVMPVFQGEQGDRKRDPSSRRLWTALREIDRYLTGQSAWLVNYAERHRCGSARRSRKGPPTSWSTAA